MGGGEKAVVFFLRRPLERQGCQEGRLAGLAVSLSLHRHPDVDGVAGPCRGQGEGGVALVALGKAGVVDGLVLRGVEDYNHHLVVGLGVAHARVVSPSQRERGAVGGGVGRVGEVDVAVGDEAEGVVDLVVGVGTRDGGVDVGGDGGVELGHVDGTVAEALVDEACHREDELADETELHALLKLSLALTIVVGECASLHDCFAFPRSTDDGSDLAGETSENTLLNFSHDFNFLKG